MEEVDFTLDLDESAYDALNAVGGYVRINKVVIAAVSEGTFVAVTQICSHQGAENITFRSLNNDFYCTQHGAIFDLDGKGLNSNGSKGILIYKTSLSGTSFVFILSTSGPLKESFRVRYEYVRVNGHSFYFGPVKIDREVLVLGPRFKQIVIKGTRWIS